MWGIFYLILAIPQNIVIDMIYVMFGLLQFKVLNMLEPLRIIKKYLYMITDNYVGLQNNLHVHHQHK